MPPPPLPPPRSPVYVCGEPIGEGSYHKVYQDEKNPGLVVRVLREPLEPSSIISRTIDESEWKASPELHEALLRWALFKTDKYGHPHLIEDSDFTQLKKLTDTHDFVMAVYIQSMRIKMRQVLKSPIKYLLPTTVTSYNDFGMQSVTRCARLETGGKIENVNGDDSINITDDEMQDMAAVFLAVLDLGKTENGTPPAFFDGKMGNLGVEILNSGKKVLRIIDVDPDADTSTVNCFTPRDFSDHDLTNTFIKYQSTFSVIAAFIEWMIPIESDSTEMQNKLTHATRTPMYSKIGQTYKLKPRLAWLRMWLDVANGPAPLWRHTTHFLKGAIRDLDDTLFDNVPDSARAAFTDLGLALTRRN